MAYVEVDDDEKLHNFRTQYSVYSVKDDEIDGACSMHETRSACEFKSGYTGL